MNDNTPPWIWKALGGVDLVVILIGAMAVGSLAAQVEQNGDAIARLHNEELPKKVARVEQKVEAIADDVSELKEDQKEQRALLNEILREVKRP